MTKDKTKLLLGCRASLDGPTWRWEHLVLASGGTVGGLPPLLEDQVLPSPCQPIQQACLPDAKTKTLHLCVGPSKLAPHPSRSVVLSFVIDIQLCLTQQRGRVAGNPLMVTTDDKTKSSHLHIAGPSKLSRHPNRSVVLSLLVIDTMLGLAE